METRKCKVKKKEMQANESCRRWMLAKNRYVITTQKYMVCSTCANWKKR